MKRIILAFILLVSISNLKAQSNIADARTMPIGNTVTVSGIITSGNELGTIRYMQDTTAGIAIYDYDVTYFNRGDSVTITGILDDYNNLLEIKNLTFDTVLTSGNPSPTPLTLTPAQLDETNEAELVEIDNAIFDNAGTNFQANNSYSFSSNGESSTVYIRSGHPLIGEVIPGNPVTLVGICSQFYANYQLLLRDTNDIINNSSINIISPITVSNISTSGFTLNWTTDSAGNSGIFYGNTPELELGELSVAVNTTEHNLSISGASASQIFYIQAFSVRNSDTAFSNVSTYITESLSSGDIKAYFTKGVNTSVSTGTDAIFLDGLVDDTLIAYINRAKYSIDFTIYDFNPANLSDIAEALNSAFSNGIMVRAIYDSTWSNVDLASLLDINIHTLIAPATENYGIMHNKFVIIDAMSSDPNDAIVWTGSTNFEDENINSFANNVVIIQDQSLAKAYLLEFNEMWGSETPAPDFSNSRFGPYKKDNTPHEFIIGGDRVECYFSPSDGTTSHISQAMQTADEELFVETMLITRYDLKDGIIEKANQGVSTKMIINDASYSNSSIVDELTAVLNNNFKEYNEDGILHNKIMIVDQGNPASDPLVLTGSHNWSNSAENRNDENSLIIHNQEIANIYYQEFLKRFELGVSLSSVAALTSNSTNCKLYPNPFNNNFNIEINLNKPSDLLISVYNSKGQLESSVLTNKDSGKSIISFDKLNLKPGIFLIKISGKDINISKRIVKI